MGGDIGASCAEVHLNRRIQDFGLYHVFCMVVVASRALDPLISFHSRFAVSATIAAASRGLT